MAANSTMESWVEAIEKAMAAFTPDPEGPEDLNVQKAAFLARHLQRRASELVSAEEKRQMDRVHRMIQDPQDKATIVQVTDETFRSNAPKRAANQLVHILHNMGIPRFFGALDKGLMHGFNVFGEMMSGLAMPLARAKIFGELSDVVLGAEDRTLVQHLAHRRGEGLRMNVNFLGEALQDEKEAEERLAKYLRALQMPEIEFISVKISTIYSQITPIAREHTLSVLCDRLELLFRAAAKERFVRADGTETCKSVYMDMEEYHDVDITTEAFIRTLDRKGMKDVKAGLALQAYVPDACRVQQRLNAWARKRVGAGGSPVLIRLVKGANMEMERVNASLEGWPMPTYISKPDTDANYKRMLQEALKPENLEAVRVGVASHNLFDLSYALVLAKELGALDKIQFEMLEGMAGHQQRALGELASNILLYAPACRKEDFVYAVGYFIRRLDENTAPENFLSHAMGVEVGSEDWNMLEQGFVDCFNLIEEAADAPRHIQDRRADQARTEPLGETWQAFSNDPNTNFALPQNIDWADEFMADWQARCGDEASEIPLVIGGEDILDGRTVRSCMDPSRPGVCVGNYRMAQAEDVDRALTAAKDDPDGWRAFSGKERLAMLRKAANEQRNARSRLMGAAVADGGKTLMESDPEVSEAIDFTEFYPLTAGYFDELETVEAKGKGVVVVVSPWNFPLAIPCGGVAAALAAGNTVILKPSSDTVLVAYEMCRCFWRAGIGRNTLQFMPCSGANEGSRLVSDGRVDVVILTGGTETAQRMLEARPDMNLLAETGGKNATIVTALSDRDLAIKHVLHSAFSHCGQKCSATSLLVLEEEVYNDPKFRSSLCEAAKSIAVGSAWDLKNRMGPLIHEPDAILEQGLKELEQGESWLLLPTRDEKNPALWRPGIKWGTRRGSFTHMTELFGPVLAVMKAKDLDEAIDIVNETGYGLTSGLESLDEREQEVWLRRIRAGNLYVNRGTTGAIVLRQPFGGMGKSAFGPGIKAGGPNYVAQLMDFTDRSVEPPTVVPEDTRLKTLQGALAGLDQDVAERLRVAILSYERWFSDEFSRGHDHMRLVGQDNIRRYLPLKSIAVRVHPDDSAFEILARVAAGCAVGAEVIVSTGPGCAQPEIGLLEELGLPNLRIEKQTDQELIDAVRAQRVKRVRYAAAERIPEEMFRLVPETFVYLAHAPVLAEGRIELLWYVQEQSVCTDYHRYGNLGVRADEERTLPE